MCGLPIMSSYVGTVLSHIALVRPGGDVYRGIYDGYGRIEEESDNTELWPLIKYEEPWGAGWGDGDGIVVHQACLEQASDLVRSGSVLPEMKSDPGQGYFHDHSSVELFVENLKKLRGLENYSCHHERSNLFAKVHPDDYACDNASICPVCESGMIEGDVIDINEGRAYQDITCTECGSSWTDVYRIEKYDNLQVSEKARKADA